MPRPASAGRSMRMRTDVADDRGRRRRRALRRPTRVSEEMRPHGRKSAVPAFEFIQKLTAARLAADVAGVPTILVARTDARIRQSCLPAISMNATNHSSPALARRKIFRIRAGIDLAIARALAYAPFADLIWCETGEFAVCAQICGSSESSLSGRRFLAITVHLRSTGAKTWMIRRSRAFRTNSGRWVINSNSYSAGFHALNLSMWELRAGHRDRQMAAYTELQEQVLPPNWTATRRLSTSPLSAPVILMRSVPSVALRRSFH